MNSLKEDSQRVRTARLDYPVNVIFHETPGKNADLAVGHIVGGEREIGSSVAVGKEDILAIYTALGNVINQSGLNASVVSRHTLSECQRWCELLKKVTERSASSSARQNGTGSG